jgi:hypothetical protein
MVKPRQYQTKSGSFYGNDGLIVPRDSLNWEQCGATTMGDLAMGKGCTLPA